MESQQGRLPFPFGVNHLGADQSLEMEPLFY